MKNIHIFFITTLIVSSLNVRAQHDSINQLNEKGHKHGYWKVMLSNKIVTTDSIQATYFAYEVYDDGKKIISYRRARFLRKAIVICSRQDLVTGEITILDGIYKYYVKDVLVLEEYFRNGYISYAKYYSKNRKTGEYYVSEWYDFDRRYNNQAGSYYFELAFTPTHIVAYQYRKGKKRWKEYRTERIIDKHISIKT